MATLTKAISLNLPRLREKKGMGPVELAKLLGVTYQTVRTYERGDGHIGAKTIAKLAKALECDETDLVSLPASEMTFDDRAVSILNKLLKLTDPVRSKLIKSFESQVDTFLEEDQPGKKKASGS